MGDGLDGMIHGHREYMSTSPGYNLWECTLGNEMTYAHITYIRQSDVQRTRH